MHPFHTGRDARYTGARTIPQIGGRAVPAAALVLHHPRLKVQIDPMFRQLDAHPSQQSVERVQLLPITCVDFYALPDLHALEPEGHPAGDPARAAGDLCAGPAVGVPPAGDVLPEVHPGAAGRGGRAAAVEGAR